MLVSFLKRVFNLWDLFNCVTAPLRQVQTSAPSSVVQKPAAAATAVQSRVQTSQVLFIYPYKYTVCVFIQLIEP